PAEHNTPESSFLKRAWGCCGCNSPFFFENVLTNVPLYGTMLIENTSKIISILTGRRTPWTRSSK
ncbi:hypothetical protein, partial [uncultured Ruminococcus sp.]|uniref:hypothetical protein n=1 Tax=uncultured Ruminococcus sp. TaxID=165186 RepID=UPI0025EC257B